MTAHTDFNLLSVLSTIQAATSISDNTEAILWRRRFELCSLYCAWI